MARAPKSSYQVRRGKDGRMGIYLREYNVRLATFNENSDELIDLLRKMFDDAAKASKTPPREKHLHPIRILD